MVTMELHANRNLFVLIKYPIAVYLVPQLYLLWPLLCIIRLPLFFCPLCQLQFSFCNVIVWQ